MSGATLPSGSPGTLGRQLPASLIALVAVVIAIVVAVGASGWFVRPMPVQSTSSRHVDILGHGQVPLEIPLMTMYTAPKVPNATVTSQVSWSIEWARAGLSTTYLLLWHGVSNQSAPVRFVFNASHPIPNVVQPDIGSIENGFLLHPITCSTPCDSDKTVTTAYVSGSSYVTYVSFRMTYDVSRVTETIGAAASSYLEVDYSLLPSCFCGSQLPAANVTFPKSQELWPGATYRMAAGTEISTSVRGITFPVELFRNNATTLRLSAGSAGILATQLVSYYRWGPLDNYVLSYSASVDTTIQYFVDLRFGSLLIRYVSP